jgi:hypothetical protein
MNRFRMKTVQIDRKFLSQLKGLTWNDICFAYARNLIDIYSAVDFAVSRIATEQSYSELELDLASITENNQNDEIDRLLSGICNQMNSKKAESEKWIFLTLFWLYLNRHKFEDPFKIIEEIYADFDYPESIRHLVKYMPNDEGKIIDFPTEWKRFLETSIYKNELGLELK